MRTVALSTFRYGKPHDVPTLVDADVAEKIGERRLTIQAGYVFIGSTPLHRIVMGCIRRDGKVVHHVNEDPFDNRRANLVVCDGFSEHGCMPHPKRDAIVRGELVRS